MRAMSWYQQQGKNMKCDHRRDSQGHCVFDCDCQEGCSEHERCTPKATLPCVSFVPARAAYHEIKRGVLVPQDGLNPRVSISEVYSQKSIALSIDHASFSNVQIGGTWTKEGLQRFAKTLLKLSEYMEG